MPGKGKSANPADAYRKAQRKKELKKNKTDRAKARDFALVKKDTSGIEEEIQQLESSNADPARLNELKSELDKIQKKKEEYIAEHPEQRKLVFRPKRTQKNTVDEDDAPPVKQSRNLFDKHGLPRHPERSIYYDPVMNPKGVAPPGMPYMERPLRPDEIDSDVEFDETEDDDDIAMPDDPAPGLDSDGSEDIPMPTGPPPGHPDRSIPPLPAMQLPGSSAIDSFTVPTPHPPGMQPLINGTSAFAHHPSEFQVPGSSVSPPLHIPPPPGPLPPRLSQPPLPPPGSQLPPPPQHLLPKPGIPPPPPGPPPFNTAGQVRPFPQSLFPPPPPGLSFMPPSNVGGVPGMPQPPPGFFPRRPQANTLIQDPLESVPHQTYQAHRMARTLNQAASTATPTAADGPRISSAHDAATISSAPQLRDLKKESTAFVPAAVKRKKPPASAAGNKINAAPSLAEDRPESKSVQLPKPDLVAALRVQLPAKDGLGSESSKGTAGKKGADEYDKFLAEMDGIL